MSTIHEKAISVVFLIAVAGSTVAGCIDSTHQVDVPKLRIGTTASYELAGVPMAPWGGLASNVQKDGDSVLPAQGERLDITTSGPYCTLDHLGARYCDAVAIAYHLVRDGEPIYLGEQLTTPNSGLLSSHSASLRGQRSFDDEGAISDSESVEWIDSFRRGSVDVFGAILVSGQIVSTGSWQTPPVRISPGAPSMPLVPTAEATDTGIELTFPANESLRKGPFTMVVDDECPFPRTLQALHPDGSRAMLAKRLDCKIGPGDAIMLETDRTFTEPVNPRLVPHAKVFDATASGAKFQPAGVPLREILTTLAEERPQVCPDTACEVIRMQYEVAKRPNMTVLDQDIGEATVERWTFCAHDENWVQIVVDWSPDKTWIEGKGRCEHHPDASVQSLTQLDVLDMAGLEADLASFADQPIWYDVWAAPMQGHVHARAGPMEPEDDDEGRQGLTASVDIDPLWWSTDFGGYIAQANWPDRLRQPV